MDISCYSAEELYKQYSPSRWTRRIDPSKVCEEHATICAAESSVTRNMWRCELDVSYGPSSREKLDIIRADHTPQDAPIFVFIHGGYWMACCKEEYSFIATPLVQSGYCFISVEYDLAPAVSLGDIVEEAQRALRYIINMARTNNSKSIYLCGHSAGAQLSLLAFCSDQQSSALQQTDLQLIKGLVLISGVYDVTPLVQTPDNDVLKLTRSEAWRYSPMNPVNLSVMTSQLSHSRVIVALAEYDSPQFRLQSQKYHLLLGDAGIRSTLLKVPSCDHFQIVENLKDDKDVLMKAILKLIADTSSS